MFPTCLSNLHAVPFHGLFFAPNSCSFLCTALLIRTAKPLSDWICMAPWCWHTRSVIYHHSPPSSSVLTSVSPYHRMGGIMRKDKQVQPGQFDKIKAPKGYRLQLCGTSQTCSVLQEYLKFPFRIVSTSKMRLRVFAPAQAELTACHYVKFPQLTWLEDRVCIQVPASGWVPQGATAA